MADKILTDLTAIAASLSTYLAGANANGLLGKIPINDVKAIIGVAASFTLGTAIPSTNPGAATGNRMWVASTAGTYTNFSGIVIAANEAAFLVDTGSTYSKVLIPIDLSGYVTVSGLVDSLTSTSVSTALTANQGRILNNLISSLTTGVVNYLFNSSTLSSYAYNTGGTAITTYITQSHDSAGLKLTPTGTLDSDVAVVDSAIAWDANLTLTTLTSVLSGFSSSNPAVALGFGSSSGITWMGYRSDGSISLFTNGGSTATLLAASSTYAFTSTSTVKIEISKISSGGWQVRCNNGTVWTSYFTLPWTVGSNIVFGMRGRLTSVNALSVTSLTSSYIAEANAKSYADTKDLGLQDQIDALKYGSVPNKLNAAPYVTYALSAAYASITPSITQTSATTGLGVNVATVGSNVLDFINTGIAVDTTKIYRLLFTYVSTTASLPAVGIAFGTSATPAFKGMMYRTNGQVFGMGITGIGAGALAGFSTARSADSQYAYVANDQIQIEINFPEGMVYTYLNGVKSTGLPITDSAVSGTIFITTRDQIVFNSTKIVTTSNTLVQNTYYVATTGNDSNSGSSTSRFATISKALTKAVGAQSTKIIIAAGSYRELLDFTSFTFEKVQILAEEKAVVRVLGSTAISGWTKTSGYTNIYETAFTGSIPAWTRAANPIFENGNPSYPIAANERHPLQKGLLNRLPYRMIYLQDAGSDLAATLTTMDSITGKYYISGGKMYIHTGNNSNPATNGFSYEYIVRAFNTPPSNSSVIAKAELEMKKIQFMFGTTGFRSAGFHKVTRYSCGVFCAITDGCWRDDAATVLSYQDEAAGSDNDGFNGHYNFYSDYATQDIRAGNEQTIYFDPWSHDNRDDGISHHERHEVSIYGGLTEYNGDSGCRPSTGANFRAYNVLTRYNGQGRGETWDETTTTSGGEGFAPVNPPLDGRNGSTCILYNCVSENNNIGYGTGSDSNNRLILIGCSSRNNINAELCANYGTILSKNGRAFNNDGLKTKVTANGGTITIENDPILS